MSHPIGENIFDFEMVGDIRRGALFSERTIRIKNNRLLYNKKHSKKDKKLFTISKFNISQNINLDNDDFRFEFFDRKSTPNPRQQEGPSNPLQNGREVQQTEGGLRLLQLPGGHDHHRGVRLLLAKNFHEQ